MAYFPFFVDLAGRKGLIVGGSAVALRKIQKLLPFGPSLTVCAPDICPEIQKIPGLRLLRQPFDPALLEEAAFVVAAAGDPEVNHRAARLCGERKIPVNTADGREYCSFLFPALVKRGRFCVGISTGGASPTGAAYWRERIDAMIPEGFEGLLDQLDGLRERVKAELPGEKRRSGLLAELFAAGMDQGGPLPPEEAEALLRRYREGGNEDGV